mmetsp:Transcript_14423/g.21256  ORF Transcript_14423/g.21256 Transcript_14423/m.21256 type:complete len:105 (+) Transcript_14423:1267-1581(+)
MLEWKDAVVCPHSDCTHVFGFPSIVVERAMSYWNDTRTRGSQVEFKNFPNSRERYVSFLDLFWRDVGFWGHRHWNTGKIMEFIGGREAFEHTGLPEVSILYNAM